MLPLGKLLARAALQVRARWGQPPNGSGKWIPRVEKSVSGAAQISSRAATQQDGRKYLPAIGCETIIRHGLPPELCRRRISPNWLESTE